MYRTLVGAVTFLFVMVALAASAVDQPTERVPLAPEHPSDPAVAKMFDDIRAHGQQVLNTYRLGANAPAIYMAEHEYAEKLRYAAKVPRHYRELIILRTTQVENGHYEYVHHVPMGLSCGMSQAQIDALPHWRESKVFDPKERAVLAFSDGMATKAGPDDATFRTLASFFDRQEIVELAFTDGFYMSGSHIGTSLGLQLESNGGAGSIPHGC
jgi:4-carboxymuconolactone decarboxylase